MPDSSIGILLKARQTGQIAVLKPLLTQLAVEGIHLSPALIGQALKEAGEI